MNAPASLPSLDLVRQALERLGQALHGAGEPEWRVPDFAYSPERFARAAAVTELPRGEALAVALLLAAECEPAVARRVAAIQAGVGGARPLSGLIATLFARENVSVASLWGGPATRSGLLHWGEEPAPLSERCLGIPPFLVAALSGGDARPAGVTVLPPPTVHLPKSARQAAAAQAVFLQRGGSERQALLALRAAGPAEAQAMAHAAALAAGLVPVLIGDPALPGLALWLRLTDRIAVCRRSAAPGETIDLSDLDSLDAPLLIVAGSEGRIVCGRDRREWRSAMPEPSEREQLWRKWGLPVGDAREAAARYRQSAGRISELGQAMAAAGAPQSLPALAAAVASAEGQIDGLARRIAARVRREDLVLPGELLASLDRLRDRMLLRNRLHRGLGPTLAARYRPGVRALFTGDSGTGKTLAAHWLAAEAGLPLYRVDLAALTSKWIGETEKNLSGLFDAAAEGDVMLFFDEADALFGARTEVTGANDRHANAQTNFLLQRIEDFDGVVLLATNSRERFDPAFVRRLDILVDFPLPDPPARRRLWDCHLGEGHAVPTERLDALAAAVDLAGGHVRNIVLAAASRALSAGREIGSDDVAAAVDEEYAKLGRTPPHLDER